MHHLAALDRVLLIEKDPRVVELWERLLGMSPQQVLDLDVPTYGDETADFFHMTSATSNAIGHSRRMTVTHRMPKKIREMKAQIARIVDVAAQKIELTRGDYRQAPDIEATWFIDPPYQVTRDGKWSQGMGYGKGCTAKDIDYSELGKWCLSRRGQVVVCEQEGADWLPFRPLWAGWDSIATRRREVVWTSEGYGQQVLV